MIRIAITTNAGELKAGLLMSLRHIGDWEPFLLAWGDAWRRSRRDMFETSGASTGTPWPMYSAATGERQYAAIKGRIFDRKMTRRDLLRWMPGQRERLSPSMYDSTNPDNVSSVMGDRGIFGTRVPYAASHDSGRGKAPDWAGGHSIPRRPLLSLGVVLELETQALMDRFAALGVHSIDDGGRARSGLSTDQVRQLIAAGGVA